MIITFYFRCSHSSQVYRASISEFEYCEETYQNIDTTSEDYETACSESSFVTCVSHSVSVDSDLDVETLSSSSSGTLVDEIFCREEVQFQFANHQVEKSYMFSSKARWKADADNLIQNYQRA